MYEKIVQFIRVCYNIIMKLPSLDKIKVICNNQEITYLGIFGSQARGDAKESSDVDVLVKRLI